MVDINGYWTKTKTKEKAEREGQAGREQKYALSSDEADLEGQDLHASGLFMMSLPNEERGTEGGQISCIPWKFVGVKIQDRTHRRATLDEIKKWKQERSEQAAALRASEDKLNSRRTISVQMSEPAPRSAA